MEEEVTEEYQYKLSRVELDDELKTDVEWCSLNLCKPILRALRLMDYKAPTPIQKDIIPPALAGQDILAMSHTGSGKTAAFLIPCLQRLAIAPLIRRRKLLTTSMGVKKNKIITHTGQCITKVLILLPTRELAAQCFGVCEELSQFLPVTSALLLGGGSVDDQERKARACPDILICTPGRCLDVLLNTPSVHLDLLDILVFDEADKLIELGFKDVCESIIRRCSPSRQTMMFSATLTSQSDELSKHCLNPRPVILKGIMKKNEKSIIPAHLNFSFVELENSDMRLPAVMKALKSRTGRVIVFYNTKLSTRQAAAILRHVKKRVFEIHGNLSHNERVRAINGFQEKGGILICTDLMARGIDICDVELVIHAELPLPPEGVTAGTININKPPEWAIKFIHRSGRTGRAGQKGDVISFYTESEYKVVKQLKQMLIKSSPNQSIESVKWNESTLHDFIIPEAAAIMKEQIKMDKAEKEIRQAEKQLHKLEKLTTNEEDAAIEKLKMKRQWIKRRQDTMISKVKKDVKRTGIHKKSVIKQRTKK